MYEPNGAKQSKLLKLEEICIRSLMKNYTLLNSLANVPYELVKRVLWNLKADQLCKLEESNPLLIFEDEEVWHNLLKKDFTLNPKEEFISKKEVIIMFFEQFILRYNATLLEDQNLIHNYFELILKVDMDQLKYRLPSRMLYFKYQKELTIKQEQSALQLRKNMQKIKEENQMKKIIKLDDPLYLERKLKPLKNPLVNRSKLFIKSYKELRRTQHVSQHHKFLTSRKPIKRLAFGGQVGSFSDQISNTNIKIPTPVINSFNTQLMHIDSPVSENSKNPSTELSKNHNIELIPQPSKKSPNLRITKNTCTKRRMNLFTKSSQNKVSTDAYDSKNADSHRNCNHRVYIHSK